MVGWPLEMGKGVRVGNCIRGTGMSFPRRLNPIKKPVSTCPGRVKWFIKVMSASTTIIIGSS
jgi:hypothetical protein